MVGEIHSRFIPFADYYLEFLVPASGISPPMPTRLLEVPGLCNVPDERTDTGVRTISADLANDEVDNTTRQFSFFDTIPGGNLAERDIRNTFTSVPLCMAFTVGDIADPNRDTLLYSQGSSPLLVAGNTIELTVGGDTAVFNRNVTVDFSRAQVCLDGTNAMLYLDCEEVQRIPFTVSSSRPINSIGVIGTPFTLQNSYSVS